LVSWVHNVRAWRIAVKTSSRGSLFSPQLFINIDRMYLLFALLFAVSSRAETPTVPVYQSAAPGAHLLFYLEPDEEISKSPASDEGYWRIRVRRKDKWLTGFVRKSDLEGEPAADGDTFRRKWGFGGGLEYTSLDQKGKSFQTDDQVQYTTTDYKSAMLAPFVTLQMNERDFWRLTVAEKKTNYTSTASTNIVGSPPQSVNLQQTFVSLLLQKAWNPDFAPKSYFGLGTEVAQATAVALQLGGAALPTDSSDLPLYVGAQVFAGGQWPLGRYLSIFGEGRIEYIVNQTPGILSLEASVGLLYWP
jgi:hypothetical protein